MVREDRNPHARSSPSSGLCTSSHHERRPAMLYTAVGSTVSGGTGGGRGAREVRSVPPLAAASGGPAALLPRGVSMPAASPGQVPADNPANSLSPTGAARGIGKRSRQDAPVPAPVPNRQQAAGGDGSSHKRPRGMVQALLPQDEPSGPSAGAPPPPRKAANSKVIPRRTLRGAAAVSAPLAEPGCDVGKGIPATIITPPAAPPSPLISNAGGWLTTGRADLLQLGCVHRGVPPPVINVGGPSGEKPALRVGAASQRPRAAPGSGIQAEWPEAAPVVEGLSTRGEQAARWGTDRRRATGQPPADATVRQRRPSRASSQPQAPHRLVVDSPNKRYGRALIDSVVRMQLVLIKHTPMIDYVVPMNVGRWPLALPVPAGCPQAAALLCGGGSGDDHYGSRVARSSSHHGAALSAAGTSLSSACNGREEWPT